MAIDIKLGALLGPFANGAATDNIAERARLLVGEGYESLWAAQSIGRGFMLTDPLTVLAIAASVTKEVEIGTAVLQVPLYHPMDLAHRLLGLQQICGDRLTLGVGVGSTEIDFVTYGRDYASRFRTFDDSIQILRDAYMPGSDVHATFTPWKGLPAAPRLVYGSWGKGVAKAAEHFDGWMASAHYRSVDDIADAASRYDAAGGGRSIVSTIVTDKNTDLGELQDKFTRFAEAGFDDAVVMLQSNGPSAAEVRGLLA